MNDALLFNLYTWTACEGPNCVSPYDVLEVVVDGHLVPASSNSKIHCSLENFTSQLSTAVCGRVTATMRQNAGCEFLKNDSKDQVTLQN